MSQPWSPEDDAELRRLIDLRLTSSQIGFKLERSRNSVIGRAHRLGISVKGVRDLSSALVNLGIDPTRKLHKRKKPVKPAFTSWRHSESLKPEPLPKLVLAPTYSPKAVPFIEASGCRRPLWGNERGIPLADMRVCGLPVERGSYCGHCAGLAYIKEPRRKRA